jgi:hypothetical protein
MKLASLKMGNTMIPQFHNGKIQIFTIIEILVPRFLGELSLCFVNSALNSSPRLVPEWLCPLNDIHKDDNNSTH